MSSSQCENVWSNTDSIAGRRYCRRLKVGTMTDTSGSANPEPAFVDAAMLANPADYQCKGLNVVKISAAQRKALVFRVAQLSQFLAIVRRQIGAQALAPCAAK